MNSTKRYNNNKPYLLIDSSYVSYYRFFSTLIWYTNTYFKQSIDSDNLPDSEEFTEDYDWTSNKIFMERYDKFYMGSIEKIRSRYNIPYENIVIVRDCPRETIWRMKIYPEYKETRKNTCKFKNKKYNIGNVFKHIYSTLYPDIMKKYNLKIVKFDNAEADDVIAVLCNKLREIDSNRLIVIITNDNDYLQLVDNKTLIWSLQNKLLNTKVEKSSKQILLKKIISGDPSDNIPPCITDISDEYLTCLISDPIKLQNLINTNPSFKKKFELNTTLIDFTEIPMEIKQAIFLEFAEFFPKLDDSVMNISNSQYNHFNGKYNRYTYRNNYRYRSYNRDTYDSQRSKMGKPNGIF
jgi:5'-3' exonuclease